jgi:AraC-like DNA-binding protein
MTFDVHTPDKKDPASPGLPLRLIDSCEREDGMIEAPAFKLLFLRKGTAQLSLGKREILCSAPCALCLNDEESPALPEITDAVAICFLPALLNGSLSMEKLRGGPKSLDVSAELDLYWAEAYLDRRESGPRPIPLGSLAASRLEGWIDRLRNELEGQVCPFWKVWAKSYLSEILFALGGAYRSLGQDIDAPSFMRRSDEEPMAAVVAYLQEKYSEPGLTIARVCKDFATNKTSLQKAFREFTGRSIVEYLRLHRLSIARELVERSNRAISDIAREVGYLDITGFERAFAKAYGFAPLAYRRLLRGKGSATAKP